MACRGVASWHRLKKKYILTKLIKCAILEACREKKNSQKYSKKGDTRMDVQLTAILLIAMFVLFWIGFPKK